MSALLHVYSTHAEAVTALSGETLADGDRVEVEHDVTLGNRRYRYRVTGERPALTDPRPLPSLDDDGRLVERLSPDAAGVLDADDYDSFADAIDAANAAAPAIQGLRLRARGHALGESRTLAEGVELFFDPGARILIFDPSVRLTLQAPIRASRRQIFQLVGFESAPGGRIVFESLARGPVPVEWFGVRPGNSPEVNSDAVDGLLRSTIDATTEPSRPRVLTLSFGWSEYEFARPIDARTRPLVGQGHLVTTRAARGGYGGPFEGTVLRWRALAEGEAALTVSSAGGPTPTRSGGFALIGPTTGPGTGLRLDRAIEASFENVCIANFAVGMDVNAAQGCSFNRFDVWGCDTGLLVTAFTEEKDSGVANANTVVGFDFNSCNLAVHSPIQTGTAEGDEDDPPPLAKKASQWRFFGGTIQGGGANLSYEGAVHLGPDAQGFLFCGVWFEVHTAEAGIRLTGGRQHTFLACRLSSVMKGIAVMGDGTNAKQGLHAFRDCVAVLRKLGPRVEEPFDVTVAADAAPVTFDNCDDFTVADASGLARVVGGYNPKTATDKLDVAPARLGLDQDGGQIPWTEPQSAPLQFTSLGTAAADAAQTLLRASKRDPLDESEQVSLWSLRTAGADRTLVGLHRADRDDPAFEFDLATEWTLSRAAPPEASDPVVIANLRLRQAQMETIIRGLVKRITDGES